MIPMRSYTHTTTVLPLTSHTYTTTNDLSVPPHGICIMIYNIDSNGAGVKSACENMLDWRVSGK